MALQIGDHTITGTLSGVEPKTNGWFRFSILEAGKTYAEKVDTKHEEIIAQAMALLGQQVTAQVAVTDSGNANPNRPGTNYLNRYLNAIGPAALGAPVPQQAAPQQPAAQQPAPQQPPQPVIPQGSTLVAGDGSGENPIKALRIARMAASERAVQMAEAGLLPEAQTSVQGLVGVAEVWVAYYLLGPGRFGVAAFDSAGDPTAPAQTQLPTGDPGSDAPHPADDDIPF